MYENIGVKLFKITGRSKQLVGWKKLFLPI